MFAFVFPGQGSQSQGMLSTLAEQFPTVINTFKEASDTLGYDLWQIVSENSDNQLNQTQFTQPALLTASVSVWRIWLEQGGAKPSYLAGHSLGEYSALVCANAMKFIDAVTLVSKRGEYMQAAVPKGVGAMAAIIGLDDSAVLALCESVAEGDVLTPANFNTPGQVVIAGNTAAVERAVDQAKSKGARMAKQIPVSVPSHCELMKPAALQMADALATITIESPDIPVIHNVDVNIHQKPDDIREMLVKQMYSPVRWVDTINTIAGKDINTIIECGPGKILVGLNKRINKTLSLHAINDPDSLNEALETVN